jgi:hypothetical protein
MKNLFYNKKKNNHQNEVVIRESSASGRVHILYIILTGYKSKSRSQIKGFHRDRKREHTIIMAEVNS